MKFLHIIRIINALLLLLFCSEVLFAQNSLERAPFVVVLDAGHGGKDPGTVSGKNYEKTVVLNVVLAVGKILEREQGVKVVYTRKDDTFVELKERSAIATRAGADLFVSVHVNSNANTSAYGSETFIMGVDKNSANLGVAMRENGVISLEKDFTTKYEGYDPSSAESHIMFSLMQYAHSQESLELAAMVQRAYVGLERRDRGVKQAGFLVLWRNSMPSILTELGFISNPSERAYLLSKEGQGELSEALANSIKEYIKGSRTEHSISVDDGVGRDYGVEDGGLVSESEGGEYEEQTTPRDKPSAMAHYAVQLRAAKKRVAINSTHFGPLVMLVDERKVKNMYKYTVGELYDYQEALNLQQRVRGYIRDAFIVAFDHSGNQISIKEAKKIIK